MNFRRACAHSRLLNAVFFGCAVGARSFVSSEEFDFLAQFALTRDDLRRNIEVMEHLLKHFYDMDYKASQVRNPKKAAALNSVNPRSVQ